MMSKLLGEKLRTYLTFGVLLSLVFYPILWALRWVLKGYWYGDWLCHLWPVGYIGAFFKHHHWFSGAISSSSLVLYPLQTFYSSIFYFLAGALSAVTGPDISLRLFICAVYFFQFLFIYQLVKLYLRDRVWAFSLAAIVSWTVYPLSNIYTRGALPEFIAATLLHCVVCSWFIFVQTRRYWYLAVSSFLMAVILGTHPITAVYGGVFLFLLFLISVPQLFDKKNKQRLSLAFAMGGSFIYILIVTAPWAYAVHLLGKFLMVAANPSVNYQFDGTDNFWVRFSLMPLNIRSLYLGTADSAPYLDAQINMPLLILFACLLIWVWGKEQKVWRRKESREAVVLVGFSIIAFAIFSFMSLSPILFKVLPEVAKQVQFAYRLVTYINLSLLVGIFGVMKLGKNILTPVSKHTFLIVALTACLAISYSGAIDKYGRIKCLAQVARDTSHDENFDQAPQAFARHAYTDTRVPEVDPLASVSKIPIQFQLDFGKNWGGLNDFKIAVNSPQWFETNVAASYWNSLIVDGVPFEMTSLKQIDHRFAVFLQPGSHTISARRTPDSIWMTLNDVSVAALFAGLLLVLVWLGIDVSKKVRT